MVVGGGGRVGHLPLLLGLLKSSYTLYLYALIKFSKEELGFLIFFCFCLFFLSPVQLYMFSTEKLRKSLLVFIFGKSLHFLNFFFIESIVL